MQQSTVKLQMVDLHRQYLRLKEEIDAAVLGVIESGQFVGGPMVRCFADSLAGYLGVKHVIPCANGTDALQIAIMALGLQPGDEIISVGFTFVATTEVIALLGLKPIFVDIDPRTYTIDVNQIERAITPRTKCIVPVHLYGQCADMEAIMALADKYGLYVIEDNAQAIGADYRMSDGTQHKAGTIGHLGCTSFYPSKNLGCYGDGGAVFTNNDRLAENLQMIANHGQREKYTSDVVGVNSRLDGIQAAVLQSKLPHLDEYNRARQEAADFYDHSFAQHDRLTIPYRAPYSTHVFHQYTLLTDNSIDRDALREQLQQKGVPTMVYYPIPTHLQKAYAQFGYRPGDLPITEHAAQKVISLPMHSEMTKEELTYIVESVLLSV